MSVEGYRQAGDIELGQIVLMSRSGQLYDLTEVLLEVNLYQNLYVKEMTCEIAISDASGILDSIKGLGEDVGGFTGAEILFLSYRTPSNQENGKAIPKNNHMFVIHSLENRQSVEERAETYVLSGTSLETISIVDKKISRSYGGVKGNTVSNMIKSIHKEFYESELIKKIYTGISEANFKVRKTLTVDETKSLQKFVIPNLSVEKTIDFLSHEADSEEAASYFTFYEDSNGYNFRDIAQLVKQEQKETYKWEPSNYSEGGDKADAPNLDPFKIVRYEVIKEGDLLENMESGLYASRTILVDPLRKNTIIRNFDYKNQHKKFSKLQKFRIPGGSESTAVVDLRTTRFQHDQLPEFNAEGVRPKVSERTLSATRSYEAHIYNKILELTFHGNSRLNVGDVVFLSFPVMSTGEQQNREDKYMTGRHLITTLRHKFDKETHVTVVECIKDTGIRK